MDIAEVGWLIPVAVGAVLGHFFRAKYVAALGATLFAVTFVCFIGSAAIGGQMTMIFGWGLVAVALLGVLVTIGALIGNALFDRDKASKVDGR